MDTYEDVYEEPMGRNALTGINRILTQLSFAASLAYGSRNALTGINRILT